MTALPDELARLEGRLLPIDHDPAWRELSAAKEAAVLILFYPRGNEICFVLTARPENLSRHPGQISLPGGKRELDDPSLWHTAIRETREEIGVDTHDLVPLGRLDDFHLRVSSYIIAPFVGWMPHPPRFQPDPLEVADIIEVSLASLLDPAAVFEEVWTLRGSPWQVAFYQFGPHRVWGATARILHDLASRLETVLPGAPEPGSVRPAGSG